MSDFTDQVSINRAYQLFEDGSYMPAEAEANRYLRSHPRDVKAMRLLGLIAWARNDLPTGAKHLERCLKVQPKSVALHWDLARVLSTKGEYARAIALYDAALALRPEFIEAITGKADVLERSGDRDGAKALLEPYVTAGTDEPGMAVVWIRMEHLEGEYRRGLELAARHLARPGGDPLSRRLLYGLCARAHEKLDEYQQAFECYAAANREEALPFSIEEYERDIEALIEVFSAQNMPRIKHSRIQSELPVFIACLPRSGSTLVEQVIHAHPKAYGAGEIPHFNAMIGDFQHRIESFQHYPACVADLTEEKCDRLARSYLDDIKRMNRIAKRITNKQLENWRHLAMVQLLLPGARVVHIKRDPLDNCFSCFMAALRIPWANELEDLGRVYRLYEKLMAHWHAVLDIPILDVQYEALVEDPDYWIRRIIDFCGLEWDDRCLQFHALEDRKVLTLSYNQVRQPIYKSAVKRYEKYEPFLGPLRTALAGK